MEVHHHPKVKKKNFKEYFLEFLMIFLAVMMGFFAEQIRENISDREKEKELMKSLIEDLEEDNITTETQLNHSKSLLVYSDSLIFMAHSGNVLNRTADFYYYGRMTPRWSSFYTNNRSIDIMKNGGWFRVIKNQNVAKNIVAYYAMIPLIKNYEDRESNVDNEYKRSAIKVFDPYIFNHMINEADSIDRVEGQPLLLKSDKASIDELAGCAVFVIGSRRAIIEYEAKMLQKGKELMALIKKEYELE